MEAVPSPQVPEGDSAPDNPESRVVELEATLKAQTEELSSLKDQYLRKLADYENFRKRMFREKDEAVQYANSALLVDLVGILDNFDRAIKSSNASSDYKLLYDGILLIEKQMVGMLETKYRLARYDSLGQPFDPNRHEAVALEFSPEVAEATVSEEFLKGYKLAERIIRTAKVKVKMPASQAASPAEPTPQAETPPQTEQGNQG